MDEIANGPMYQCTPNQKVFMFWLCLKKKVMYADLQGDKNQKLYYPQNEHTENEYKLYEVPQNDQGQKCQMSKDGT